MFGLKDLLEGKHYIVERKTTGEQLEIIVLKSCYIIFKI